MWVGRERERGALADRIREARAGRSTVLVLLGGPGLGKTALLDDAVASCDGVTLLRARGLESESELPYAGLGELLAPLLQQLGEIPGPQAHALAIALALKPASAPVDRLAVCAATLSLLARGALERPIVALLDDAQWLDEGSAQALVFAARRLASEGIALVAASRGGDHFEAAGFARLTLAGLSDEEALTLLAQGSERLTAPVARRLAAASGGNPLALLELPGFLSEAQRAGHEPLDEPLPIGPALERAFGRALSELPAETRAALRIAAASGTGDAHAILRALEAARLAKEALEPAESAELVAIRDGRIVFRHPLLRAVAYHSATPAQRRLAHESLADGLADVGEFEEEAWQRAAAALEPDEPVARAMEQAAARARERGAPTTAARGFERAARLTPEPRRRAARLRDAALEWQLAGEPRRSLALLDEAAPLVAGMALANEIAQLRGRVEIWLGRPLEAHDRIAAAAHAARAEDPGRAAEMLAEASFPALLGARIELALATARESFELSKAAHGAPTPAPAFALAIALLSAGREAEAEPLFRSCEPALETADPLHAFEPLHLLGRARMFRGDHAGARRLLERLVGAARQASALGMLPFPLISLAELDLRTGRWPAASAEANEAVQLAAETGQATDIGLLNLAVIDAVQGREVDCRRHIRDGLAAATGNEGVTIWAGKALGLLALAQRQPDEARRQLEPVARFCAERRLHCLGAAFWEGDFVEALIQADWREEAQAQLDDFEPRARDSRHRGAAAAASRCRGLLAGPEAFEACFRKAQEQNAQYGDPFERARTDLLFGERLRRERRRREAVRQLQQALDTFDRLGALLWSERAREELRSCGERVDAPAPSRLADLTPQELQVALVVARGATNREAGTQLFLSEKTIETHLGRVYRKLAVRSRTELANLVLAAERVAPERESGSPGRA